MKRLTLLFYLLIINLSFGQTMLKAQDSLTLKGMNDDYTISDTVYIKSGDTIYLRTNKRAKEIDSLWLNRLVNSPLNDTLEINPKNDLKIDSSVALSTDLLKSRLQILNSKTPFNIDYNPILESVIKSYLNRKKEVYSNLMERAQYYFPMFEQKLDKYNIPLEMKYLAIVESALIPTIKSRVGATGLWQFMFQTGKLYNLNINSYVDDRSNPIKATEAACQYLKNLHDIFGDWDLVLAAYNSGPGNVTKAIRRSGGKTNYWSIRQFLPRETAGYVPAFYATLYMFEFANENNIKPKDSTIDYFETDSVFVKRQLTFEQLHKTLKVDIDLLKFLNPQYKLGIIPFQKERLYSLRLPRKDIGNFITNEQKIYKYADAIDAERKESYPKFYTMNERISYRVRSGDVLGKIARKFGVSVNSIKRWNRLKTSRIRLGQRLTIYPRRL